MSGDWFDWLLDFGFRGTRLDWTSGIGLFDPLPWSRKARRRRGRRKGRR